MSIPRNAADGRLSPPRRWTALVPLAGLALLSAACNPPASKDGDATKKAAPKPEAEKAPPTRVEEAAKKAPDTAAPANEACKFPDRKSDNPAETAWRLFIASVCPTGLSKDPLAFEVWTEQTCIQNPSAAGCGDNGGRTLHGSVFRARRSGLPDFAPCEKMTTADNAPPSLKPLVPSGKAALADGAVFCEEVYVNDAELAYLKQPAEGQSLTTHAGQAKYIQAGNTIDMPPASVEIKVDWLPAKSLKEPFTCAAPPKGVYVEDVDGECYALVGFHLTSKLFKDWIWATFEPQNPITNPNRCREDLYGECQDRWGAEPATNKHDTVTALKPEVEALMRAAKLPEAFLNYRLTGVQTAFTDGATVTSGGETYAHNLGSSFVEFNAKVPVGEASCITCHASAQLDPTGPKEQTLQEFAGPYPAEGHGGVFFPPRAPFATQDFSWMLGFVLQ